MTGLPGQMKTCASEQHFSDLLRSPVPTLHAFESATE